MITPQLILTSEWVSLLIRFISIGSYLSIQSVLTAGNPTFVVSSSSYFQTFVSTATNNLLGATVMCNVTGSTNLSIAVLFDLGKTHRLVGTLTGSISMAGVSDAVTNGSVPLVAGLTYRLVFLFNSSDGESASIATGFETYLEGFYSMTSLATSVDAIFQLFIRL